MTYSTFKVVHLLGVMLLFLALGAIARTGERSRAALAAHGTALAIVFLAGFGMLGRLHLMQHIPLWAWLKMGIWLLLGAAVFPLRRSAAVRRWGWVLLPILGGCAAALAVFKPI